MAKAKHGGRTRMKPNSNEAIVEAFIEKADRNIDNSILASWIFVIVIVVIASIILSI